MQFSGGRVLNIHQYFKGQDPRLQNQPCSHTVRITVAYVVWNVTTIDLREFCGESLRSEDSRDTIPALNMPYQDVELS